MRLPLSLSLPLLFVAACSGTGTRLPSAMEAPAAGLVGTLGDAPYRIDRPANWNGELVVYFHGYEPVGMPRPDEVQQKPFDLALLAQGYAVAQSAYSTQGWAVAEALVEAEQLRQFAVESLGPIKRTWAVGNSLGAHAALASIELHPQAYDGALALCGINAPATEVFADGLLPPLLAFDAYFPGALGLAAGGLADPASPPMVDPAAIEAALQTDPTKAARIADGFDIRRDELAGALMLRYLVLREMIVRAGGFPIDNRAVRYPPLAGDADFDAAARRYAGDPAAMAYLAANAPLAGTPSVPVVVQSNLDDPTATIAIASRYAALAAANGAGDRVTTLPPVGKGHCEFTDADIVAAFAALTAKAAGR